LKNILCQELSKSISNLIFGVNGEYFDKPLPQMFAKMMVAYVDVLGSRAKLGKPCQFKGARVVFKEFAIHVGLGTKNLENLAPSFPVVVP
jgi:hypothetical protein